MRRERLFARIPGWAAVLFISSLSGCSYGGDTTSDKSLRGTNIQADFTFANSRSVDLTVSADSALFGNRSSAGLQITNPAGGVLYEGPLQASEPMHVRLVLPKKDNSVQVTFRTQGVEKTEQMVIADNKATHTFQ